MFSHLVKDVQNLEEYLKASNQNRVFTKNLTLSEGRGAPGSRGARFIFDKSGTAVDAQRPKKRESFLVWICIQPGADSHIVVAQVLGRLSYAEGE